MQPSALTPDGCVGARGSLARSGGLRRGAPVTGSWLVLWPVLHDAVVGAAGAAGAGAVAAQHLGKTSRSAPSGPPPSRRGPARYG
jgi:hypothetical protein